ncbi:serine carboxypeptidase-like 13 isoform X1 [Benincasa hispida]|uniref:serine carboxypeptidase-like 13 isoform X1 n=1 Tax=Benincasa hispida TaxID=102211 RepID=UPI001900419F|nr:serine carboxypeptidase-like 13 isoform X1 [Benincasa hispida]
MLCFPPPSCSALLGRCRHRRVILEGEVFAGILRTSSLRTRNWVCGCGRFRSISDISLFYQIRCKSQNGSSHYLAYRRSRLLCPLWTCLCNCLIDCDLDDFIDDLFKGPISFKEEPYNDSIPELLLNPYSWTKKSSIIFVDLPAGTGFSYDTTSSAFKPGDFSQIHHYLQFLRKWLVDHPEFITNPFYVGGDSYSGMIVPVVAQKIVGGNTLEFPIINFQGYILGNPYTIRGSGDNFAIPFAHRMTLISEELFESLKTSCKGKYVNIDPTNVECLKHYKIYKECISNVEPACILDPKCPFQSPKQQDIYDRRSLNSIPNLLINQNSSLSFRRCPEYKYKLSNDWANTDQVWKALHVREGSIEEWIRCKNRKDYTFEIESVFSYHVKLSSKGYRSLIYSGDHDMLVPHLDTQTWIKALNYSIVDDWRPWFILDQVAGYTRHYANNMTFATIKGGGHTAEYTRRECSIMFSRWISGESL